MNVLCPLSTKLLCSLPHLQYCNTCIQKRRGRRKKWGGLGGGGGGGGGLGGGW